MRITVGEHLVIDVHKRLITSRQPMQPYVRLFHLQTKMLFIDHSISLRRYTEDRPKTIDKSD
jgi:hypothetical protein